MFSRKYFSWIILLLLLCLYLFFPSGASTSDAWYYAASIKYRGELFHPHHLLYNPLGYFLSYLPAKAGIDVLGSLKVLNALFAVSALFFVQRLLRLLDYENLLVVVITGLTGLSFAVIRFATENETYIVPLFFALVASNTFLKYLLSGENRYILFTGIWMTAAVLFHQTYIFWWLGFLFSLISSQRKKPVLIYILISLSGPIIYLLVILISSGNLRYEIITGFILGDAKEGAYLSITARGLFFSLVSLIRSFIQVHGYIFNLARSNILFLLPGIISVIIAITALYRLPVKNKNISYPRFAHTLLIIILLQFIFAILAAGNAEFMVMIPVLTFILIPLFTVKYEKFLMTILAGIALWNISYGLLPLHFKSAAPEQFLCNEAVRRQDLIIIASDDQLLKNMVYYQTGNNNVSNIYKSPATLNIKGINMKTLEYIIDSALVSGITIYTDCVGPSVVSRASIMEGNLNSDFFRDYELRPVRTWSSVLGTKSVYSVLRKL